MQEAAAAATAAGRGPHEKLLEYSMVARKEVVLAEYSPFSIAAAASFAALATRAASLISPHAHHPNAMLSFTVDQHAFHFLLQDDFRFVVVSNHLTEKKIAFICLQRIKEHFFKCYMDVQNETLLSTPCLDRDFRFKLKEHMEYCIDHSEKLQKLPSVRDQVLELQENIMENIQTVQESHVINLRVNELEVLQAQVENFQRQGKKLKNKMCVQQARIKLVAILICIFTISFIWLIICKGLKC